MAELGYEFVGLHAIKSLEMPRLAEVRRLASLTAEYGLPITPVLLTKVVDAAQMVRALAYTKINWLQLHHPWSISGLLALHNELHRNGSSARIILLVDPTTAHDRQFTDELLCLADFVILDHRAGGTGRLLPFDSVRRTLDMIDPGRVFLAGGLDAENVAEIVRRHQPYAVDAQSGLLNSDGAQDPEKLAAFIHAVRGAPACESSAGKR
ncbi:phosphoribosylanthranilate isomerase [Streptomyces sp. NPDC054962]